jgi:hypothetical protein
VTLCGALRALDVFLIECRMVFLVTNQRCHVILVGLAPAWSETARGTPT